jgi:signal transduction histidine kinase
MANCLSVLAGNCSFDDKGQAAIGIIRDELQRLNKLTHDFLLFGRPGVAPAKPVMLARALESTCANLERHIAQEALAVKVHWRARARARACAEPVMIDPSGLETVLCNLLLNAAQAIAGSGEISAVVHQTPRHFTIAVSDTGTGIPPEERQKIFDPFYSRKSHGAGLGLAIVHRFVKSWQGRIRIISEAGRGTTFLIRAPIPTLALRA